MTEKRTHTSDCDWHVDQYPWECTCGFIPRKKAMDDLIAQDADLIAKPDPLVEVMNEMGFGWSKTASEEFRAAIEKRGGKIVWGEG